MLVEEMEQYFTQMANFLGSFAGNLKRQRILVLRGTIWIKP